MPNEAQDTPTCAYSVPQARERLGGISHCHFYTLVKAGRIRIGTVSVFNGPEPLIRVHSDEKAEITAVGRWLSKLIADGTKPAEIGIFVRTRDQLDRARAAAIAASHEVHELSEGGDDAAGHISIGTMHLAKGLEFKAVAVMACDDEILPLQSRVESVADEVDLDDVTRQSASYSTSPVPAQEITSWSAGSVRRQNF